MKRRLGEMRVLRISLQFAAFIMLFLFIACTSTSTKFSSLWKDEAYRVQPEKILVMSVFQNPATRWTFEDELVRALKNRGIDAVMSYTVMPDMPAPELVNKDAIAAMAISIAKEVGADTVLINGLVGRTTDVYNDIPSPQSTVSGATIYREARIDIHINTQTDVFDMKSNRLIMSASAETWVPDGTPYTILVQAFAKDLVNKLSQLGLF
jgi:sugar-specific transcriptional regulator TrmB